MSNIKKAIVVLIFISVAALLYPSINYLYHETRSTMTAKDVQEAASNGTISSVTNQTTVRTTSSTHFQDFVESSRNRFQSVISRNGDIKQSTISSGRSTPNLSEFNRHTLDKKPYCAIPPGGYKSWKQGVVTVLKPIIQRNCTKLFAGDKVEAERIKQESESWMNALSNNEFLERTRNCSWLREELTGNLYNTALEKDIPMAYIFVINGRPQSVFRNIKLLYRPQNTFCINFDTKSPPTFKEIFKNIDRCFENIMIGTKQENIIWGYYTIMEAQLNCHYDLLKYRESQPPSRQWKYIINLCGKELPLMSPHEMVSRLSVLNGSASIMPKKVTSRNVHDWERISNKVKYSWWYDRPIKTDEKLESIPFNLIYYKSSSYNILSLKFVRFLLMDPIAREVHNFFMKAKHSEEHFYATLFMMPGVPGGYDPKLNSVYVRAAHSTWLLSEHNEPCYGTEVNSICTISAGDLPMIMRTSENRTLFHNKYLMERDHTAMDCLEEMIVEKNKLEYQRDCLS